MLVTHIGDGRAAYLNEIKEWNSIITPFLGEEAGSTVFITSKIWNEPNRYIESRVVKNPVKGIVVVTDGYNTPKILYHF